MSSGPVDPPPPPPDPPAPVVYYKAGNAGNYGAGGGAASYYATPGSQGVIVIEYEPLTGSETSSAFMNFAM